MQIIFAKLFNTKKKEALTGFFFFILLLCSYPLFSEELEKVNILNQADELKLSEHMVWQTLLHFSHGKPTINDPVFYTTKEVNPKLELNSAIENLYFSGTSSYLCKFPARYFWLRSVLHLPELDLKVCNELFEFIQKAPIDRLSVVFASEIVSQPSSIMGHILLRLSGRNSEGIEVDHAISFFTDVDGVNLPKLIFESLITGKNGYYTLSPYRPVKNEYLFKEQRSVWEYELNVSEFNKKLLQYHLYELKHVRFTYFFHTFNCATLVRDILAVLYPELSIEYSLWVTPLDVIRRIDNEEMVSSKRVTPSSKWIIKTIVNNVKINKSTLVKIKKRNYNELIDDTKDKQGQYINLELAKSYNNYLFEKEDLSKIDWDKTDSFLSNEKNKIISNAQMDLSNFKNPSRTPSDSQLIASYMNRDDSDKFRLGFLPASHTIFDNTTHYTNESELRIGEFFLGYEEKRRKINIDAFTLYSAKSFQPSDYLTGGLSGKFQIGYDDQIEKNLTYDKFYFLEGGLGKTIRVHTDIDVYAIFTLGFRAGSGFDAYIYPEFGMILREIFDMKSILSLTRKWTLEKNSEAYYDLTLSQVLNLQKYSFIFTYELLRNFKETSNQYTVSLKRIF